jgi:hypothetical protein
MRPSPMIITRAQGCGMSKQQRCPADGPRLCEPSVAALRLRRAPLYETGLSNASFSCPLAQQPRQPLSRHTDLAPQPSSPPPLSCRRVAPRRLARQRRLRPRHAAWHGAHRLRHRAVPGVPVAVLGRLLSSHSLQVRAVRPEVSRDYDVFFSSVGLLCGGILVFQARALSLLPSCLAHACAGLAPRPAPLLRPAVDRRHRRLLRSGGGKAARRASRAERQLCACPQTSHSSRPAAVRRAQVPAVGGVGG